MDASIRIAHWALLLLVSLELVPLSPDCKYQGVQFGLFRNKLRISSVKFAELPNFKQVQCANLAKGTLDPLPPVFRKAVLIYMLSLWSKLRGQSKIRKEKPTPKGMTLLV